MDKNKEIKVEVEQTEDVIKQRIFIIRGQKVMIDTDLAELYGVVTKRFNEQVKRNKDRFPEDFMFQLDADEGDEEGDDRTTTKITTGQRRQDRTKTEQKISAFDKSYPSFDPILKYKVIYLSAHIA